MFSEDENSDLFSLLQLSDSFFPIGGYSLSFGLETYSQYGILKGKIEVQALLEVFVSQLSTSDCIALRAAYVAIKEGDLVKVSQIDRKLASFKNVKEIYEASRRTGRTLLRTVMAFKPSKLLVDYSSQIEGGSAPGLYPVCLSLVCDELGVSQERAVSLLIYTLMINILGAAIRLGHITHIEAQQILHFSKKLVDKAVIESSSVPVEQMRIFSPSLDIMGMQHTFLSSKMFSC